MENTNEKLNQLKTYLNGFMTKLDNLDPNETSVQDIDQLIEIVEQMEKNLK